MEGGGQPVLSCAQCFIVYLVFLSICVYCWGLGGLGFEFARSSPDGGILFGVSGILLLLLLLLSFIKDWVRGRKGYGHMGQQIGGGSLAGYHVTA